MISACAWFIAASFAALGLCVFTATARGKDPHVDASLFPGAYGVSADERLMYPVDMSDWPAKITSERQLFLDDYLIASLSKVTRQVHPPTRHPVNPILRFWKKAWEHGYGHSVWVLRDEQTGQFRMWYNFHHRIEGEDGVRYRAPTCYATSDDGVHWVKPNLGIWSRIIGKAPDGPGATPSGESRFEPRRIHPPFHRRNRCAECSLCLHC